MSKHLLRSTVALGIAALALSLAGSVRAADEPAAKPEKPKVHQFTGIVESLDAKAGSAVVKSDMEGKGSKTFKLVEKTKYATLEKKEATSEDIKVGDKVTVRYVEEKDGLVARRIGPTETMKKKAKEKEKEKEGEAKPTP